MAHHPRYQLISQDRGVGMNEYLTPEQLAAIVRKQMEVINNA